MLSSQITSASRLLPRVGSVGVVGSRQKHTLPALPYDYNALEPCISAEIMQIHHQKHHQTYVNNLNAAEDALKVAVDERNTSKIISLQPALKFNGGGHLNHSIFWEVLSPKGGGLPSGDLMQLIKNNFGSFDKMKDELTAATIGIQGSGWGWLGYNPGSGRLRIATMPNQDPLFPVTGLIPLFGIDVWEHAYYLQYKNVRPDYVKAIFDIANWKEASRRFEEARMSS